MSGPPVVLPLPTAAGVARRWLRDAGRGVVPAIGIAAFGVIVGLVTAIVLVASERPSFLSGPAEKGFPSWMVGPLAHRLPGLPPSLPALQGDFTRALVILGIAWVVATVCAPRIPAPIVWTAVIAAQVVLLLGPPLSLTDVFNYLHYGRMAATYGTNPYAALPLTVPQDPAFLYSNWHHLTSPYGPLFTLLTEALAPLSLPAAYWAWKVVLLAASIGTLVLVAIAARRLGRSPQAAIVLVGLNPLVLVYGIGGDHNDPLMLLCGVAAVALAIIGREAMVESESGAARWRQIVVGDSESTIRAAAPWWDVGAGAAVVLAAGFKPSAILLAPIVILGCRRRLHALAGAAGAGVFVLAVVGLVYGGHLPSSGIQDGLVNPLSVPNVLAALAGQGAMTAHDRTIAHVVLALATVGATAAVLWRRSWLPGAAGFVMLAGVLTLGWTMPWYVWWVLPFAALARTRVLAVVTVVLTVWLALGAIPQMTNLIHHFGYYPTRSAAGRANHLYTERYLQ
ncbi:MAG TPA: polyprenol phosphomannose-dependent alpha 1,6 mannosyltransferase MptB [Solirubrobacteraceae bacterium]|nr:polyprenol phosphomannose-dependent alpha 1,6 mannosyltransferase MptB [Solirubrobacteraceae bacterium]